MHVLRFLIGYRLISYNENFVLKLLCNVDISEASEMYNLVDF